MRSKNHPEAKSLERLLPEHGLAIVASAVLVPFAGQVPLPVALFSSGLILYLAVLATASRAWQRLFRLAFAVIIWVSLTYLARHYARDLVTAYGTPITGVGPSGLVLIYTAVWMPYLIPLALSAEAVGKSIRAIGGSVRGTRRPA